MRVVLAILASIAASGTCVALAQDVEPAASSYINASQPQENPEEIVVRGRRIGELRAEVEDARERAYELFNDLNGNDEFDVYCRRESRSGTNVPQVVCRAQFENRISADAAQEYMASLAWQCPGGPENLQECMFNDYSSAGKSAALGIEGQLPGKREQMTDEIFRVARENDEFAQAILDWYEASQQYDAARKRRKD